MISSRRKIHALEKVRHKTIFLPPHVTVEGVGDGREWGRKVGVVEVWGQSINGASAQLDLVSVYQSKELLVIVKTSSK